MAAPNGAGWLPVSIKWKGDVACECSNRPHVYSWLLQRETASPPALPGCCEPPGLPHFTQGNLAARGQPRPRVH